MRSPDPMLVRVGDMVAAKYRVDRVLGIGGMGMVVAATHLELEQRVAIKFMLGDAAQSQSLMDRFLREARATVRLRSEHVCRVFDVGRLDTGAPYIVMELMDGHDLAQVLRQRGQLPLVEAVDLVMQVCEGVADAHANRIVHRDLKPGNLFVTTRPGGSPLVKVLDFGISKSSLAGAATKTGEMMGSPAYMAPEQMASSKDVDHRADVYALGVIVFEMLAHALPFVGETLPELCMAVMNAAPRSLAALRPDLPPAVVALVMRCLDRNRDRRPADVGELAVALAPFGSPEAAPVARRVALVVRPARSVGLDSTLPEGTAPAEPVPRVGGVSTLQSSAAEISGPPRGGRAIVRRRAIAVGVGTAIVAAIAFVVTFATADRTPAATADPLLNTPAVAPAPVTPTAREAPASPVAAPVRATAAVSEEPVHAPAPDAAVPIARPSSSPAAPPAAHRSHPESHPAPATTAVATPPMPVVDAGVAPPAVTAAGPVDHVPSAAAAAGSSAPEPPAAREADRWGHMRHDHDPGAPGN